MNNPFPLFDDENNNETIRDVMIINNSEDSEVNKDEWSTHFIGSSQTESQLRTARLAITNDPNNNEIIATSTYYKHDPPVFKDIKFL